MPLRFFSRIRPRVECTRSSNPVGRMRVPVDRGDFVMNRLVIGLVPLLVLALPGVVSAEQREQRWKIGEPWRVDESPRQKEAAEQAERNRANTVLFAQILCVAAGGLLVWVAAGITRNGFGIGPPPRWVSGKPAWAIGGLVAALGLAVAVVGVLYISELIIDPDAPRRGP